MSLGGGNDKNATIIILKKLYEHLGNFKIKLIIGNNVNYKKIINWVDKNDKFKK